MSFVGVVSVPCLDDQVGSLYRDLDPVIAGVIRARPIGGISKVVLIAQLAGDLGVDLINRLLF